MSAGGPGQARPGQGESVRVAGPQRAQAKAHSRRTEARTGLQQARTCQELEDLLALGVRTDRAAGARCLAQQVLIRLKVVGLWV